MAVVEAAFACEFCNENVATKEETSL